MTGRFKGLVLCGFGLNCDYETAHALRTVGFEPEYVHINDLASGKVDLMDYHLFVFGGGFAWADDHGAGVLLGHRIRATIMDRLVDYLDSGRLVIGICNGFQCLVNLGLLPDLDGEKARQTALLANDCGSFRDQWVRLKFNDACPSIFTKGLAPMDLPVRHGEGKLYAEAAIIDRLENEDLVAARYVKADDSPADGAFPDNPNGAFNDIAALTDPTGRVLGLMPHPECFHHLTNHPDWTLTVDRARRKNEPVDWNGRGLELFVNALKYLEENF